MAQEVEHEDAVSLGKPRQDILPQVRRGERAMYQHDRITGTPVTKGVAVQPDPVEVDELTAHQAAV